jgi:hypothetical protein
MTQNEFDRLLINIMEVHVKGVMCKKSEEYSRGDDKLYNFKRASEMSGNNPEECLRGMKLKHDVSLEDMLDDLWDDVEHPQELWQEKLRDEINYLILLWALLSERYEWEVL